MVEDSPAGARYAYQYVTNVLRSRILAGELKPGDKLPTRENLALEFDVSENVVRQALNELSVAGLLLVGRGRPAIIQQPPISQVSIRQEIDAIHALVRQLDQRLQMLADRIGDP